MRLTVNYSKQSLKFLKKNNHFITREKVLELISQAAKVVVLKQPINIDLKSLQGDHKGYYRIRYRTIRIIFALSTDGEIVVVDIAAIDYRGNVY